jgi:hypothetical protein
MTRVTKDKRVADNHGLIRPRNPWFRLTGERLAAYVSA